MAKCPSCSLLLRHGVEACTCGTPVKLISKPREIAMLIGFAVLNLAATVGLCQVLFKAIARN